LAQTTEAAQGEAEEARLLYVAATRAKEKLIVSGHDTGRASDAWLAQLAEAADLDLDQLAQKPGEARATKLKCGKAVSGLAQSWQDVAPIAPAAVALAAEADARPLFAPLAETAAEIDGERKALRPRRITGRARHPDGTLVGDLVHACIRRWRFPGDAGFERTLATAARGQGLVDAAQAAPHLERAAELLSRLRADSRWGAIDRAERRHEVPYSLPDSRGIMDLLYRDADGVWQIVDFKTDTLADDAELQSLADGGYGRQMRRYGEAVQGLLGRRVATTLCFLDDSSRVKWWPVVQAPTS
jgi:ATP-dependent exoDNAse (exonuclease V) beta subunit